MNREPQRLLHLEVWGKCLCRDIEFFPRNRVEFENVEEAVICLSWEREAGQVKSAHLSVNVHVGALDVLARFEEVLLQLAEDRCAIEVDGVDQDVGFVEYGDVGLVVDEVNEVHSGKPES